QRLVEGTDVDRRLAEIADANLVASPVADRESEAGGERDVAADDPVTAHEPPPGVEQVHRATLPLRAARRLAEQLGHQRVRRHSSPDRLPVLAVRRNHVVVLAQRGEHTSELQSLAYLVCRL